MGYTRTAGGAIPANDNTSSASTTFGFTEHRVAVSDVDAERLPVYLASELALGAEAKPVILHAVILNVWVSAVRCHLELHKVPEAKLPGLLELLEEVPRRTYQAKVNVLRSARVLETQLKHEAPFERHCFPENSANPSEKAVKH